MPPHEAGRLFWLCIRRVVGHHAAGCAVCLRDLSSIANVHSLQLMACVSSYVTDASRLLVACFVILQAALLLWQVIKAACHPSSTHGQLINPCCLSSHWSAGLISCLSLSQLVLQHLGVLPCKYNHINSRGNDAAVASRSGALGAAVELRQLLQLSAELDPCLGRLANSPLHRTPKGTP